jgi:hypothetical protein
MVKGSKNFRSIGTPSTRLTQPGRSIKTTIRKPGPVEGLQVCAPTLHSPPNSDLLDYEEELVIDREGANINKLRRGRGITVPGKNFNGVLSVILNDRKRITIQAQRAEDISHDRRFIIDKTKNESLVIKIRPNPEGLNDEAMLRDKSISFDSCELLTREKLITLRKELVGKNLTLSRYKSNGELVGESKTGGLRAIDLVESNGSKNVRFTLVSNNSSNANLYESLAMGSSDYLQWRFA